MSVRRFALVALLALLGWCGRATAAEPQLRVSLGYHFSIGDYGSDETTEIMYVPLAVKGALGPWSLQVTVPYLRIDGGSSTAQGPNGPVRAAAGDGLGDVLARASYTIEPRFTFMPWIDLVGAVKFPTASAHEGLGTGKFDYTVATDLTWMVGNTTPFVSLGYRILGGTRANPLHDAVEGTIGAQYRVASWLQLGALFDWREAASTSSAERLEIVPFATIKMYDRWSVSTYISAGLADGSPAVGSGLTLAWTR